MAKTAVRSGCGGQGRKSIRRGFFFLDNIAERQHSIPKVPTHPDPRVEDEQELRCTVECSSRDQAESGERRSERRAQKARMGAEAAQDADGGSRWS